MTSRNFIFCRYAFSLSERQDRPIKNRVIWPSAGAARRGPAPEAQIAPRVVAPGTDQSVAI
jgi:hypothetical protein